MKKSSQPIDADKIREYLADARDALDGIEGELPLPGPEPLPPNGTVVKIRPGDDIGAAIRSLYDSGGAVACAPGDYFFNFSLDARASKVPIILTTDTDNLPAVGSRITPDYLPGLACFRSDNALDEVIRAPVGTGGLHFMGVAFGPQQYDRTVVALGNDTMEALADMPTDFSFDRVLFYGDPERGQHRGIQAHAQNILIEGCYFQDFHEEGRDSQCIAAWNGGRNILIDNCHLEAGAENILIGGSQARSVDMIPQDIRITRNLFVKPERWQHLEHLPSIKCLLELKNVQRCWIEGNVFDGCWSSAKPGGSWGSGVALAFKVAANGSQFTKNEDTTCVRNVIRNVGSVIVVIGEHDSGEPTDVMLRIVMAGNLAYNVNVPGSPYPGDGKCLANGRPPFGMTFNHNTVFNPGTLLDWWNDDPSETGIDLAFTNNAVHHGSYGVRCPDAAGIPALDEGWPNEYHFTGNAIKKHPDRTVSLPPGNVVIKAADYEASFTPDHRVIPGSAVAQVATTDALLAGADLDAIQAALADTESL